MRRYSIWRTGTNRRTVTDRTAIVSVCVTCLAAQQAVELAAYGPPGSHRASYTPSGKIDQEIDQFDSHVFLHNPNYYRRSPVKVPCFPHDSYSHPGSTRWGSQVQLLCRPIAKEKRRDSGSVRTPGRLLVIVSTLVLSSKPLPEAPGRENKQLFDLGQVL
jgi:hypothetical protein